MSWVPKGIGGQAIIVVITERLIPDLGSAELVAICEADDTDTSADYTPYYYHSSPLLRLN